VIAKARMLVLIAFRNLLASRINLLIGMLILGGTVFFIVVGALLSSLKTSMARSVIGSLAGHVQIYSAASKDELALYGGGMGNEPDLAAVTDFPAIKKELEALPNVKVVVPMGSASAMITSGNIVDVTLEKLRNLVKARDGKSDDPALTSLPREELDRRIAAQRDHVRQIIKVLQVDADKVLALVNQKSIDQAVRADLKTVGGDEFWKKFDEAPYDGLEFLENRIAPQVSDAQMVFLRYVGTDLDVFQKSFDRMEIIDGGKVPPGHRGFLIPKFLYEEQLKLKNARRLDKIRTARTEGQRLIANDTELQRFVKENRAQTRDIVLQLDALATVTAAAKLKEFLHSSSDDLGALLIEFFDTTDANFDARYDYFYKELAPMLQLYRVRIGDSLTIKAFSRAGAAQAVNVKVYGTFAFTGLEKSPLAGAASLMDLMSFRDLYGYLTTDKKEELQAIQRDVGAKQVTRDNAEAELFGEDAQVVAEAKPTVIDAEKEISGAGRKLRQKDLLERVYSPDEINGGVVLNAAVILKNGDHVPKDIAEILKVSEEKKLGLKASSWQQASGTLGQIIDFIGLLMIIGVVVIFGSAMVIINNAMMMATLQRTQLIGTMRAIGAQRRLVLSMVVLESVVLGLLFGGIGMVLGAVVMAIWHAVGTGAPNDIAYFLFSGARFYPELSSWSLLVALGLILVVTVGSTLLPAYVAARISPLRAMQADE
jgi:ABC-type lipoprotein release transport system permease subunit